MSRIDATGAPLPDGVSGAVVVSPPDGRTGAPSAIRHDGVVYLGYRLRRPEGEAIVIGRSDDGVGFETVATVGGERFGAASLGRPALVVTPAGRWRLYLGCATPGSERWRVELLEADSPAGLAAAASRTVLPGDDRHAVTDPVVQSHGGIWHLWASVHPLDDPGAADRMTTEYATSPDGVVWTWQGTALAPRPGRWDSRGVRISSVIDLGDRLVATYDGRASAAETGEERTGLAVPDGGFGRFRAVGDRDGDGDAPAVHGLRHLAVLPLPGGGYRLYYEVTRPDGAHELRTEQVPADHAGGIMSESAPEPVELLEGLRSTPSRRYLAETPIPEDVLWELLDTAVLGPSGGNRQQWGWVLVTDPAVKAQIAGWYQKGWEKAYGVRRDELSDPARADVDTGLTPSSYRAAEHLAQHLDEAPVFVVPVLRDAADSTDKRLGSSVYGAVQQLLLAARAYGIGGVLTTLYLGAESQVAELLGLPDDAATMGLIPLGYPVRGRWSRPRRRPVEEVVHWGRWGETRSRV